MCIFWYLKKCSIQWRYIIKFWPGTIWSDGGVRETWRVIRSQPLQRHNWGHFMSTFTGDKFPRSYSFLLNVTTVPLVFTSLAYFHLGNDIKEKFFLPFCQEQTNILELYKKWPRVTMALPSNYVDSSSLELKTFVLIHYKWLTVEIMIIPHLIIQEKFQTLPHLNKDDLVKCHFVILSNIQNYSY